MLLSWKHLQEMFQEGHTPQNKIIKQLLATNKAFLPKKAKIFVDHAKKIPPAQKWERKEYIQQGTLTTGDSIFSQLFCTLDSSKVTGDIERLLSNWEQYFRQKIYSLKDAHCMSKDSDFWKYQMLH